MFVAAALLVGVAIGYCVGGDGKGVSPTEKVPVVTKAVADKTNEANVQALRRRIAELEKRLAEASQKSEVAVSNAVAEVTEARAPEPPRVNWRERMEEMKKNDPERYAQMTNRIANWRRSRAEQARNKIDFLSSVDTSHMGAKARQTHADLQELLAKREEIEEQLHQEDLSDERRRQLMGELHATNGELWKLNGEEQKILLDEMSRNLGFDGAEAEEITATVQEILKATETSGGFRMFHGGRGPGGARGPGGRLNGR